MDCFHLMGYEIQKDYCFNGLPNVKTVISAINPHSLVVAQRDEFFQEALQQSNILIPDGIGIVLSARWLWGERFRKLSGDDLHLMILRVLDAKKGRCFYLGSSGKVLEKILQRLAREFPHITAGCFPPPYRKSFTMNDSAAMIRAINDFSPDVLFVGLTAPKQEKWIHQYKEVINAPLLCAIGGAFDFYAGTVKRAPKWVVNAGLEWLYRFIREPVRMWRRNLISTPVFMGLMLSLKMKQRRLPVKATSQFP